MAPLGIKTPRIGKSLESEQLPGEVRYYTAKNDEGPAVTGPSAGKEKVPVGYGTWRQETLDAHGGWIASTIDLAPTGSWRWAARLSSRQRSVSAPY